jgi:glycosyltransferase involved in cell wall biosynthesis
VVIHDALYATSMIAAVAARRAGKPTILIQHISGIPFVSTSMRLLMKAANGLVTQRMLRRADQVVFISDTVRRDFSHVRMRRPARLIFNGVDARTFSPGAGKREAFDLPEHGKIVAFVGRFVEKKGLAVLREVARLCPEVCFALAGAGPIDPSAWGLANVRVLGPLSRRDVADLFRTSDALLLPSVGEGYPLVIQEAMACGLPVICGEESARADPDAGQWLRGVTIDLRNPAATAERIVQAMSSIAQDAMSRDEMAKYAGTNYNWSRMVNEILEIAEVL